MNNSKVSLDTLAPFAVATTSFHLAEVNQAAALVLTLLGCVYTSRKIWVSFKTTRNTPEE